MFKIVIKIVNTKYPRRYTANDKEVINANFVSPVSDQDLRLKILFDHYKMSSEMARQAIDRRIEVNKFFVAAFGAAAAAVAASVKIFDQEQLTIAYICLLVGFIGILLATYWRRWIVFLIDQSTCRQEVLEEFEKIIPASHWRAINARLQERSADSKALERTMPLIFILISLLIFLFSALFLANPLGFRGFF